MNLSRPAIVPVVGVTFVPTYPNNLLLLAQVAQAAEANGEQLPVVLVRNPANPYDANATEVHIPALGDMAMIGHLSREIAARIAPRLDGGARYVSVVHWVRIDPDHLDRPGIDVSIARVLDDETLALFDPQPEDD